MISFLVAPVGGAKIFSGLFPDTAVLSVYSLTEHKEKRVAAIDVCPTDEFLIIDETKHKIVQLLWTDTTWKECWNIRE